MLGEIVTIFAAGRIAETSFADFPELENTIMDKIGLNVVIKNNKNNKGSITFSYKEMSQLNKIIDIIKSNY